jgi:hypothetical protein
MILSIQQYEKNKQTVRISAFANVSTVPLFFESNPANVLVNFKTWHDNSILYRSRGVPERHLFFGWSKEMKYLIKYSLAQKTK